MNKLEQAWHDSNREKYKMDGLQLDNEPHKPHYVIEDKKPVVLQQEIDRRKYLAEKYGIRGSSLECDGILGMRLQAREESLADVTIQTDRERSAGMKLATATVNYQGKPMRLWVEVSKF